MEAWLYNTQQTNVMRSAPNIWPIYRWRYNVDKTEQNSPLLCYWLLLFLCFSADRDKAALHCSQHPPLPPLPAAIINGWWSWPSDRGCRDTTNLHWEPTLRQTSRRSSCVEHLRRGQTETPAGRHSASSHKKSSNGEDCACQTAANGVSNTAKPSK